MKRLLSFGMTLLVALMLVGCEAPNLATEPEGTLTTTPPETQPRDAEPKEIEPVVYYTQQGSLMA